MPTFLPCLRECVVWTQYWVLGFFMILLGSILDFVAFGLAPQSFLAPLAALSLVWNMLLAPKFHGEKITRQNLVATTIICIGVTSSVIFSGHGYVLAGHVIHVMPS
jgi:magnesium transporter